MDFDKNTKENNPEFAKKDTYDSNFGDSIRSIQSFEKYISNIDNCLKGAISDHIAMENMINSLKQENEILRQKNQEIEESKSNMKKIIEDRDNVRFDKIFLYILSTFSDVYNEILDSEYLDVTKKNVELLIGDLSESLEKYGFSIDYHKRNEKPDNKLVNTSTVKTGNPDLDGKIARSEFGYSVLEKSVKIFKQEKIDIYEYDPKLNPNAHLVNIELHNSEEITKLNKYSGEVLKLPSVKYVDDSKEFVGWSLEKGGSVINQESITIENDISLYSIFRSKKYKLTISHKSDYFKDSHPTEEYYVRAGENIDIPIKKLEGLSPDIEKIIQVMPEHDLEITVTYTVENKLVFDDKFFEVSSFDHKITSDVMFTDEKVDVFLKIDDETKLKIITLSALKGSENKILLIKNDKESFNIDVTFEGIFISGSRGCESKIGNAKILYEKNLHTKNKEIRFVKESNESDVLHLNYVVSDRKYKVEFIANKKTTHESYSYGEVPKPPTLKPRVDNGDYVCLHWNKEIVPVVCAQSYIAIEERLNFVDEVLKSISSGFNSSRKISKNLSIPEKFVKEVLEKLLSSGKVLEKNGNYKLIN